MEKHLQTRKYYIEYEKNITIINHYLNREREDYRLLYRKLNIGGETMVKNEGQGERKKVNRVKQQNTNQHIQLKSPKLLIGFSCCFHTWTEYNQQQNTGFIKTEILTVLLLSLHIPCRRCHYYKLENSRELLP